MFQERPTPAAPRIEPVSVDVKTRRWALRAVGIVLGVQSIVLGAITVLLASAISWDTGLQAVLRSTDHRSSIVFCVIFGLCTLVNAATAIGFLFSWPGIWLRAMVVQGILLLTCLSSYVAGMRPSWLYLVMLLCVVNVLYLNTSDVRLTYHGQAEG